MINELTPKQIGEAIKHRNAPAEPKRKRGRPKGSNTRPGYIVRAEEAKKFIKENDNKNGSQLGPAAKILKQEDQAYLLDTFSVVLSAYDLEDIPDEKMPRKRDDGTAFRFTPRQMYMNAVNYIKRTIQASQPLTITGLGLFMGYRRKQLFAVLDNANFKKLPEFSFIYDFADFIEMYNEYVAHRKQNPAAPIFILKNFGWKDKFEIEASTTEGALTDKEREEAQKRMSHFSEPKKIK